MAKRVNTYERTRTLKSAYKLRTAGERWGAEVRKAPSDANDSAMRKADKALLRAAIEYGNEVRQVLSRRAS